VRDGRERLDALYRQYTPGAFGLAYVLVHDREIAQDLVHDAFVNTAARLHQLRDPEAFGAYLRRAVANGAASRFRRHKVETNFLARECALRQPAAPDAALSLDDADVVMRAMRRLPVRQQLALIYRFYLDWTDDDIAAALHCRAGTARSLISRGLSALRTDQQLADSTNKEASP